MKRNINVSDLGQSKYRSAITQRADLGQSPVVECQRTFPLPPFSGHSQLQQTVFHTERTAHPVSQINTVLFYITAISTIRTTNTPLILYYPTQLGNGQSLANMHLMFCWQRQEERYWRIFSLNCKFAFLQHIFHYSLGLEYKSKILY